MRNISFDSRWYFNSRLSSDEHGKFREKIRNDLENTGLFANVGETQNRIPTEQLSIDLSYRYVDRDPPNKVLRTLLSALTVTTIPYSYYTDIELTAVIQQEDGSQKSFLYGDCVKTSVWLGFIFSSSQIVEAAGEVERNLLYHFLNDIGDRGDTLN